MEDARRGVELDDPSGHQHRDPVGQRLRFAPVVGDQDRGDAIVAQDGPHVRQQRGPGRRVEPGERFVEQQHLGLEHEGPCQGDALRLAPGERPRALVAERRDVEPLEPSLDARAVRLVAETAEPQSERDVVRDGHVGQERALEDRRHPPPLGQRVSRVHRTVVEPHGTPGGTLEQPGDPQERRLAAAIRADHGQDLAAGKAERGHVEHGGAAVGHLYARQLDDRRRRHVGRTWIEPRWIENSQCRSRSISRIS